MQYVCKKTFVGKLSMRKGEARDLTDKEVINDLVTAGYIEEMQPAKKSTKGSVKNDDC